MRGAGSRHCHGCSPAMCRSARQPARRVRAFGFALEDKTAFMIMFYAEDGNSSPSSCATVGEVCHKASRVQSLLGRSHSGHIQGHTHMQQLQQAMAATAYASVRDVWVLKGIVPASV